MSTNVRMRGEPPASEQAAGASPVTARLPCPTPALSHSCPALPLPARPCGAAPGGAVRSAAPCPAVSAAPHRAAPGRGRAAPALFWRQSAAEEGAAPGWGRWDDPLPRETGPDFACVRAVPSRPAAARGPGSPRLRNCPACPWAARWVAAGRGGGRQEGKARSPGAHTLTHTAPARR